ncbi:aspartate:alanine exchanger family transporter [Aureivirga sp. CE67]|uniref:aspartate:alanine exchanger family transporter n=1 Tax=Aureivirga sp. CE67 TaxID=1788983 RepID=UPI0018CBECFD|nr:TrkA C-terminal domain-containing protein [Aureivirga sp. CE67]
MDVLTRDYVAVFVIIALGIFLGKFKIKGVSLGTSAVLFVALIFGHYGVVVPPIFKTIGLIFFIFTIGIQAGPGFFDSFRSDGLKLIIISAIVVVAGGITAVVASYFFNVNLLYAIGIYTGALTSTPGLASAIDATGGAVETSIGYGVVYPFGVLGVILVIRLIPKIFRIDVEKEEQDYYEKTNKNFPKLAAKNFIVSNENIFDKSFVELKINSMTGANISRILKKGQDVFMPNKDLILEKGDIIRAVGSKKSLKKVAFLVGEETDEEIPTSDRCIVDWVLVTNKKIVNKSLSELSLGKNYNATVTRIRRAGIDMTPNSNSRLRFGDKLMIVSGTYNRDAVIKLIGDSSKKLMEIDFLPISIAIILGIVLGNISVPLFGINFKLGITGGVLLISLMLSRIGKTGNIIWNVSGHANQLLRQMGLLFFLASIGTSAGTNFISTIEKQGIELFLMGIMVTIIPMFLAVIIGRYILKINFLSLLGALTGGMTSTPGLSAITSLTKTNAPPVAYATVYPFAMVILIICTKIIGAILLFK